MKHSCVTDQNAAWLKDKLARGKASCKGFHPRVVGVLSVIGNSVPGEEFGLPKMRPPRPDFQRTIVKPAQGKRHVDHVGTGPDGAPGGHFAMGRLQAGSSYASIAGDEFADEVVAEQVGAQTGNNRIGQKNFTIKRSPELREYSPARAAFPKHRLRGVGDLKPGVALLAGHTIIVHNSEGFPEVLHQRQRKKIAQNNAPCGVKQKCRVAPAIVFQSPGGALLLRNGDFELAHHSMQDHFHPSPSIWGQTSS
jgi:hypothetical protein